MESALVSTFAHLHVAQLQLAERCADWADGDAWCGDGIRTCEHWLTINTGCDPHTGGEYIRVGRALRELPLLCEACSSGALSFDKVRLITRFATAADEQIWIDLARAASGAQLARICREFRRATTSRSDAEIRRSRGLWTDWSEPGLVRLRAVLPTEEAELLMRAIDSRVEKDAKSSEPSDADEADEPWAAKRVDALLELVHGDAVPLPPRLVVHVDLDVLAEAAGGTSATDAGHSVLPAVARRLGCDASVVALTERDGMAIDAGRSRRLPSAPLRRAVQSRDRTCRFPGCGVPAQRTHSHHIRHWIDGGETTLENLVSLCGHHHRRLHDGEYGIERTDGTLRFLTTDRRPIGGDTITVERASLAGHLDWISPTPPDSPRATDGGAPYDSDYAISVIADAVAYERTRAPASG